MDTSGKTVHIISHTHWDREWFLNSPYTNEWLMDFFTSLFEMLDREPSYRFVLDGQTLLIEDFLDELDKKGLDKHHYLEKIKSYTREKRLFIGPYYLQLDWQLVSGESLIRNILIGRQMAEELGSYLPVGWLMDNFGQISQAVQIHRGFDLQGIFVWRGVPLAPQQVRTEFNWKSPDGSTMPAVYLIDSYRNAMRLSDTASIFQERISHEVEKLEPFLTSRHVLLMNGYDQDMVPDDILPLLRTFKNTSFELRQSSPLEYLRAVMQENPDLPTVTGPLYSGRYISVFPGVLSSRIYLKQANEFCQRLIERYLEPFLCFSWLHGGEYPSKELQSLWKLLLKNHAHDDICGVSIDDVHRDMEHRFETVREIAESKLEDVVQQLSGRIDTQKSETDDRLFAVFNPSPFERCAVLSLPSESKNIAARDGIGRPLRFQTGVPGRIRLEVPSIPGFGYTTVRLTKPCHEPQRNSFSSGSPETGDSVITVPEEKCAENRFLKLTVHPDGSFSVTHKVTGKTWNNLGIFEDTADAGDTYNYSPLPGDTPILSTSFDRSAKIRFIENGPLLARISVSIDLKIPRKLNNGRKTRSSTVISIPIVTHITIEANSPIIRFRTYMKNRARDHRLRLLFPTGIRTSVSHSETQFDIVDRPIKPESFKDEITPELQRVIIGAREKSPITTFPQLSFVDLNEKGKGITIFNHGLPEYEIIGDKNTMALTLFRSVGWLARTDLVSRHGDAGPLIQTPEAQCLREMDFHYGLFFHQGDRTDSRLFMYSELYKIDPAVIETDRHTGELPMSGSFLSLSSENNTLQFSALKQSEDGEYLLLRCYNPVETETEGLIRSSFLIEEALAADLGEKEIRRLDVNEENECRFTVRKKEIYTLKLRIKLRINRNSDRFPEEKPGNRPALLQPKGSSDKPKLPNTKIPPLITPKDISEEEKRLRRIQTELEQEERNSMKAGDDSVEKKAAVASLERSLLEARLSVLLLKKKLYGPDIPEIRKDLRELGLLLNKARIKKRTYDYLVENAQASTQPNISA
jgi:mannosylglycerate hydrolase